MTGTKCDGVCDRHDNSIRSYLDGQMKKCTTCDIYLIAVYERCFCCNSLLREKPKSPKDKKTEKGDQAFVSFGISFNRAKNEVNLLAKFSRIPEEKEKVLNSFHDYLTQAIDELKIIRDEGRQRPEYVKKKVKAVESLMKKVKEG